MIDFVKLHGLGNDFVFIEDLSSQLTLTEHQVAALCNRHKGIGADGVILVRPSVHPEAVAYMHYINSDGTLAQMCGNGVRCFAKYLVDRGFVEPSTTTFMVDTLAGIKQITCTRDERGNLIEATVDMGEPLLAPDALPTTLVASAQTEKGREFVKEAAISSPWAPFSFTGVSMGNPHAVCFIDDFNELPDACFTVPDTKRLDTLDLEKIGPFFESHEVFPEKANIEFAQVKDDGIAMRVYERGCGETLACGTGACAVNVAAYLTGRAARTNTVHLKGGDLSISWDPDDGAVYMTGIAEESFRGTFDLDALDASIN